MKNFSQISGALHYIDQHLDEPITLELLAEQCFLSPFYFHKLFSAVVGKPLAAYIRDRRVLYACRQLSHTDKTILEIALDCGFHSSPAFSRAFRQVQGISPSEYRASGQHPILPTAEELILKFTNRLRGGILLDPNIIKRETLRIAGTHGDGAHTAEVWGAFLSLWGEKPLPRTLSASSYEVRLYQGSQCTVHVGYAVPPGEPIDPAYSVLELPPSQYASFDVYVSQGYESENNAMDEWLATNRDGYTERLLDEATHYCVEYYDERFNGGEAGSIVEIWVPIQKA